MFRHACRSCHTLDGYKALKPAFSGTDRAFIASIIRSAHLLKGNMPPFLGKPEEAEKIADYIYKRVDQRPLDEVCNLQGVELGRKAYAVRCGKCHVIGAASDKAKSFAGQSADDLSTMLNAAADMGEGMPAYTGGAKERAALVMFMEQLGKGAKK